jgi:hypothetical protein
MCPLHWPLIAFALGRLYGRWSHSIQFVPLGGDATILEATSTVGLAVRTIRIGKIPVNAWNVQSMASADGDVAASLQALPPALRHKLSGRLLDDGAEREQRFFVERSPDQLETERQTLGIERARDRNAGKAGHVDRHRENVV